MAPGSGSRGYILTGQPGGVQARRQVHTLGVPGQAWPCNLVQPAPSRDAVSQTPQVGKAWRKRAVKYAESEPHSGCCEEL